VKVVDMDDSLGCHPILQTSPRPPKEIFIRPSRLKSMRIAVFYGI
jgi:hypothetical protein